MPYKAVDDAETAEELTPMELLVLMTAQPGLVHRVRGWVSHYMRPRAVREAALDRGWDRHQDRLIAEAGEFGFVPASVNGVKPSGPGLERWVEKFRQEHGY